MTNGIARDAYRGGATVSVEGGVKKYTWDVAALMNLVDLVPPTLTRTSFKGRAYWFGYAFKPGVHPLDRRKFFDEIEGRGSGLIPEGYLTTFINEPLALLNRQINLATIDFFVYPVSSGGALVKRMVTQIDEWMSHDIAGSCLELVRCPPSEIGFDWEKFNRRYAPTDMRRFDNRYRQMREYVEEQLLPKIRQGGFASLPLFVKATYRPYLMNFIDFNADQLARFERLRAARGGSVLVLDDVNETGSTLNEILRMLGKVNPTLDIYLFTLMGRLEIEEEEEGYAS